MPKIDVYQSTAEQGEGETFSPFPTIFYNPLPPQKKKKKKKLNSKHAFLKYGKYCVDDNM